MKTKRNDLCPCGSGKKYKRCCLPKEEAADREACAYWKAKIRRVVMDRLADQQMAQMPAPTETTQAHYHETNNKGTSNSHATGGSGI